MKKRDVFITLIFLLIAFYFMRLFYLDLTQTISARDQVPVGTVVVKRNIIQRRFADRALWDRLRVESPVYIGNMIRVPDASAATLYIEDVIVDLEENTLIRITHSPDGEIQIDLNGGNITLAATENSGTILLNHNGNIVRTVPGLVLSAQFDKEEIVTTVLPETGFLKQAANSTVQLITPAQGSVYRYFDDDRHAEINFNWTEAEDASSYILEVSNTEGFSNPAIQRETSALIDFSVLDEGKWYWRVIPVLPAVFEQTQNYSAVSSFSVEKSSIPQAELEQLDFSEWLAIETINNEQVTMSNELPPLLAAPVNLRPADGYYFGTSQFRTARNIIFNWSSVNEANDYILTVYKQTEDGIILVARSNLLTQTSWMLRDLSVLNSGIFTWQVEAIERDSTGFILRRAFSEESKFIVDVPVPDVELHETRNLYDR